MKTKILFTNDLVEVRLGIFFSIWKRIGKKWVCASCYGDGTTNVLAQTGMVLIDTILFRRYYDTPTANILESGIKRMIDLAKNAR